MNLFISQSEGKSRNWTPGRAHSQEKRRKGDFLVRLWLSVSSKGTVASLNSQAVLTPTFSGQLRSSPVPFLFLVFHIYKNEAERSTPVPSWKEINSTKCGTWIRRILELFLASYVITTPCTTTISFSLSFPLFPSFFLSLSHTSSSYNLTEDIFEGHFNFLSLALAVE